MTQAGTTACAWDLRSAEADTHVGNTLQQPSGEAHFTPAVTVACLRSGPHADSRIFTKGLSALGIVHRKPNGSQHSLNAFIVRVCRQI